MGKPRQDSDRPSRPPGQPVDLRDDNPIPTPETNQEVDAKEEEPKVEAPNQEEFSPGDEEWKAFLEKWAPRRKPLAAVGGATVGEAVSTIVLGGFPDLSDPVYQAWNFLIVAAFTLLFAYVQPPERG